MISLAGTSKKFKFKAVKFNKTNKIPCVTKKPFYFLFRKTKQNKELHFRADEFTALDFSSQLITRNRL